MQKIHVLLVQLPVPNNTATNVPLAAGYLKAYASARGLLDQAIIEILPRSLADYAGDAALVEAIVAHAPDVLGFSLYTWNSERSLALAERVKQRLPGVLVIAGGPEVQPDNAWVLHHSGLDIAIVGEGEQTFADLVQALAARTSTVLDADLQAIPGLIIRDAIGKPVTTPERVALADLRDVPSPYLLGYLELQPTDMLMVEVSRWCPYACSFCLYGRNMGTRLGNRYFPLERILDEIRWGRERGLNHIHFIEANLNLVPPFQPLMQALAEMNADRSLVLYAELRGEHLTEVAVDALVRAGLRVAEVGLQTANLVALQTAHRRTDLQKWAAGTRRLYANGVEVLLDVILGLPNDDAAGVAETLDFIEREQLGAYDAFTLQILPGTAVRREAAEYQLQYQDRPPYFVLATNRLNYPTLRSLRRDLKHGAGLDPDAIEGCPLPRFDALTIGERQSALVDRVDLRCAQDDLPAPDRLAAHVDLITDARLFECVPSALDDPVSAAELWLTQAIAANPATLFDLYVIGALPTPATLRDWRNRLPFQAGYLDRVAVYRRHDPQPGYDRVSPRIWLVRPWIDQIDPHEYAGIAEIIWAYRLEEGEEPPLTAWERAGGAGIAVHGLAEDAIHHLRETSGLWVWKAHIAENR